MASQNVKQFDQANWKTEVLDSPIPVVVDFWATWCGPCRMIAPFIDQLADEYAGRVKVGKVNVDDSQDLAADHQITTIPQVYIFKGGQLVEKIAGAQPKNVYAAAIQRALK